MGAKIDAAIDSVRPGSTCSACVILSGSDLNSVRSVFGGKYNPGFGPSKGTLFATPGSKLSIQATIEIAEEAVSNPVTIILTISSQFI